MVGLGLGLGHQAEVYLGRKLTLAETIWLNFSAKKADYVVYYHSTLLLVLFYSLAPLPYVMMHSDKTRKFKIQPKITNSFSDILRCYRNLVIHNILFVVGPLQIFSYPILKSVGIKTSLPLPCRWEVLVQILVYVVVEDYAHYWLHRSLHCEWGYERIHKVHHEYTAPIAFAASYAHWAEVLILGFATFLGPFIVPCHITTLCFWIILRQTLALHIHSGYVFPWCPSKWIPFYGGPEFHDYHHFVGGKTQSNFGSVFTYCDYIYGTDKGYRYHKKALNSTNQEIVQT